jgi:hypothetical protein
MFGFGPAPTTDSVWPSHCHKYEPRSRFRSVASFHRSLFSHTRQHRRHPQETSFLSQYRNQTLVNRGARLCIAQPDRAGNYGQHYTKRLA